MDCKTDTNLYIYQMQIVFTRNISSIYSTSAVVICNHYNNVTCGIHILTTVD